MFKIASFNVNSINARLGILLNWLEEEDVDVLMLQELKCTRDKFPAEAIEGLGYNWMVNAQKTYNGVAILSKRPIENIITNFALDPAPEQARFIEVDTYIGNKLVKFINIYVPNGGEIESDKFVYKLNFFDSLYKYLAELNHEEMPIFIGGDFNVALTPLDVYDQSLDGSVCYNHEERIRMRKIISLGFLDLFRSFNPNEKSFSWWDYRGLSYQHNKGMRIDYILANSAGASMCHKSMHVTALRAKERPSDHVPVLACLS